MALRKITDADLVGKGVVGQPDVPGLTAREMQLAVEGLPREVIIPIINENAAAQDEINAANEAFRVAQEELNASQGGTNTAQGEWNKAQEAVNAAQTEKNAALDAKDAAQDNEIAVVRQTAENGVATADNAIAAAAEAQAAAEAAQARADNTLAKDNTIPYTPTADYHPATKKFVADEVARVNTEAGAVTPDMLAAVEAKADGAQSDANTALSRVATAIRAAQDADDKAVTAQNTANAAVNNAGTAQARADEAYTLANGAQTLAQGKADKPSAATVTISASNLSGLTATVTVNGVTASNIVMVAPADDASRAEWVACNVRCTAQAVNTLTFTADTAPSADIAVNVAIWEV